MSPLDALKDIHLPPAISWWPPAPGWWLLAALVLGLLWWLGRLAQRHHQQHLFSRQSRRRVKQLWSQYLNHQDSSLLLKSLLILARQTAKSHPAHEQLASKSTADLLSIIDTDSKGKLSTAIALTELHDLLYQASPKTLSHSEARQVFLCLRRWIHQTGGALW